MAGAEVIVSSGDLMTVKEEEGDHSGNGQKTQVIPHLQPILHRVNDDIVDTATTVLAIETHHEDSEAEGEETEYGYPITCGDSRAVLLFKKFVCPGINVRCVKFNDQLISPKQFVHLAGKATLKDWKRAIRLGGVMLRKMMDSGQIDFYQHGTVCSNTCRSTKFDVLINSTRLPPGSLMQPSPSCLAPNTPGGTLPLPTGEVVGLHNAAEAEDPLEEKFSAASEWSSVPARPVNHTTANGHAAKRKRADTPDGVLSLWKGVADAGLMGEVLSSLQNEVLAALKGVEDRSERSSLHETDAVILNSLCKMFGLLDSVKQALDLKHSQDEVHNSDYVLEEILEDQRTLGRDKSSANKMKSLKRLRPWHQDASNSQSPSFLSPSKISPVIPPLPGISLSATSYNQLTINPQLLTHFSACTGQCPNARAGRADRNGHSNTQEREGDQEKLHRFRQEVVKEEGDSGIHNEPIQRTRGDPHVRSEETERKEVLHDVEKVVIGRNTLMKRKSKGEIILKGCWTK